MSIVVFVILSSGILLSGRYYLIADNGDEFVMDLKTDGTIVTKSSWWGGSLGGTWKQINDHQLEIIMTLNGEPTEMFGSLFNIVENGLLQPRDDVTVTTYTRTMPEYYTILR